MSNVTSVSSNYKEIKPEELSHRPILTTAEKVAKWGIKLVILVTAILVGGIIGAVLSTIMPPHLGIALGSGACFLAAIASMELTDTYFNNRAIKRLKVPVEEGVAA